MKREFDIKQPLSTRRPLKVYAFDPMLGKRQGGRITLDIPNEADLKKGPIGERIEVIDYDGANDVLYSPVNLNDETILMQHGLEPTESDPRFHQQMVYAVAMKVLENFDIALGRKLFFLNSGGNRRKKLTIYPHAFQGANAFYDPEITALCFGYFKASETNPGPNLPGQTVFTCLSQDIIVHEMTHAIVDRLRPSFKEPTNVDVAAFHEGFSDIIAIFQHFTFPSILREHIQETRGNLTSPNNLINLASEFGYATGQGKALRSAIDTKNGTNVPDPTLYKKVTEPHERGSILVAAVFEAFFNTYQTKIKDLVRIATGGTGRLPDGDLHPDLVNRIANEASRTAQAILNMCIRAFEYLPPVDITFGDYLRALVTADYELSPNDESGQRLALIEAFRSRGIYPENVTSLAEESLLWESFENTTNTPRFPIFNDKDFMMREIMINAIEFSSLGNPDPLGLMDIQKDEAGDIARMLGNFAKSNAKLLHLDDTRPIQVRGFHTVFRVNNRGQLLVEMVTQFIQEDADFKNDFEVSGGLSLKGGTTVIASANGEIRYVISKPLESKNISKDKNREAKLRRERQEKFVQDCDKFDSQFAWSDESYFKERMMLNFSFKATHNHIKR